MPCFRTLLFQKLERLNASNATGFTAHSIGTESADATSHSDGRTDAPSPRRITAFAIELTLRWPCRHQSPRHCHRDDVVDQPTSSARARESCANHTAQIATVSLPLTQPKNYRASASIEINTSLVVFCRPIFPSAQLSVVVFTSTSLCYNSD